MTVFTRIQAGLAFVAITIALVGAVGSAFAVAFDGVPVPGPIAGAGLPALIVLGGAYWLVRKLRRRPPN
jgi:hypothetical protein